MHFKYYSLSAIIGGLIIFGWQALSHAVIPWPGQPIRTFTDNAAVVTAVQANTQGNGVYEAPQGVFTVVSFRPDMADKSLYITDNLIAQAVISIVVAGLLAWLLLRTGASGSGTTASLFAAVAVIAAIQFVISDWNWYGFSSPYAVFTIADAVIGWFLAGLFIGWARRKYLPVLVSA